jgi:hypothetical protein
MAKYVYLYTGGRSNDTPEAQEQSMAAWGAWLEGLGAALTDFGNPFGASATVNADGSSDGASSGGSGYSIVEAGSLLDAVAKTKGCPVLDGGGTVEVFEAIAM